MDVTSERAKLKEEEQRLAMTLATIRTKLNALLPVYQLPVDVLEEIFAICVSWLYEQDQKKPRQRLSWSQVCRYWRHVSLNSARLWRCIDLCDSRLAREFLVRSKTSPLSIVSASPLILYADDLRDHAERLHSIEVVLFPDDMKALFSSIGHNLSKLSNLFLKIPPVSWNIAIDVEFPALRRLTLDSVAIPWGSCQGLTHLSLRGLGDGLCPSVPQLFSIFEKSPRLEYLHLEALSLPVVESRPDRVIPLAHLRELVIFAKTPILSTILAGISYPPSTRLRLHSCAVRDLGMLFPRGISCWEQKTTAGPEDRTFRLARHAVYFLGPTALPWSEDLAETLISITSSVRVISPVLSSIDTVLTLSSITVFELDAGITIELSKETIRNFLALASNLETIRIGFNNLQDLLSLLTCTTSDPADPDQLLCPRLQNLLFGKIGDIWWHFSEHWLHPLTTCARERRSLVPLKMIQFTRCHGINDQQTEELKEYVQDIVIEEVFE